MRNAPHTREPDTATPEENPDAAIAAHLQAAPDEHLLCREGRHDLGLNRIVHRERVRIYDPHHDPFHTHGTDHIQETRLCPCCTTMRIDLLDEQTRRLCRRRYVHPDGYLHAGARIDRGKVRAEWERRHPIPVDEPTGDRADNHPGKA